MADIVDVKTRSRMMAGIRGENTRPEMALRGGLHALGARYRLHQRDLPGKPDLVFPRYRAAVFVHGCFWHRHEGCRFTTNPATNSQFWTRKFDENVTRDQRNLDLLAEAGWRTAVVWECALKAEGGEAIARRVILWLKSDDPQLHIG